MTDRFQWASLARLAPTYTHEWAWAEQCAERLRQLAFFRVEVEAVYFRVWSDDAMFGCPVLTLGTPPSPVRSVVVPRATPLRLSGPDFDDPVAVIVTAWPRLELGDTTEQETAFLRIDEFLTARASSTMTEWGLTARTRDAINKMVTWPSPYDQTEWMRSFERVWRGSWQTSLTTYTSGGDPIGWTGNIHRPDHPPELFMAVAVGEPPQPWMSHRLPQSAT